MKDDNTTKQRGFSDDKRKMDDVLRRMLKTPPDPKQDKPKSGKEEETEKSRGS